jgi:hypothetical protein
MVSSPGGVPNSFARTSTRSKRTLADTPEAITAMEGMNAPTTQPCRGTFSTFEPEKRLALTQVIDFIPRVAPYNSVIAVDFFLLEARRVRMIVTLGEMHDAATTVMQREGFTSQLSKPGRRNAAA